MGEFNRGGRRDFGGERRSFGPRRDFDGPRKMFDATCSECGKACQVPFQPKEDRPVYCQDCFKKKRDQQDSGNEY